MISVPHLYEVFKQSNGISTDTRTIQKNQIFFAIRGDTFDGNEFVEFAIESGALAAVVERPDLAAKDKTYLVDDVLEMLQKLARFHRDKLAIPVIAITGTNGKTTTKELMAAVLSTSLKLHATSGNFNNHLGVPLTLLSMPPDTEVAVVEMGANHPGEIGALCEIARPTYGMITNIGRAHLEGFGNYEGVLRAKTELFDFLRSTGGIPFINTDDPTFSNMLRRFPKKITFPGVEDSYSCSLVEVNPYVKIKTGSGKIINSLLIGQYNFSNIAAALCVGHHFEVPESKAIEAIQSYQPSNNRSQVIDTGRNKLILDAYNANPESMKAALASFNNMSSSFKVVILGDMLELGEDAEAEHVLLGKKVSSMKLDKILFVGSMSEHAANHCQDALYFPSKLELETYLKRESIESATILIKASRGIGLESLVELL